jgi:hypothetical protein
MAMEYVEELPLKGILIWDERLVVAPKDGILKWEGWNLPASGEGTSFFSAPAPRRVVKNEVVAKVDGVDVKVSTVGYFSPALDKQEGNWFYSRLWSDASAFFPPDEAVAKEDGAVLRKGEPLGKLVEQPQDLKCIAYLDKTPSLVRDIEKGWVNIKMDPNGKSRRAEVRTYANAGQKIKVCLTVPFFPPSVLLRRAFSCTVLTGNQQGVSIPETAVILKEGKQGVFVMQGSLLKFVEVEGFSVDKNYFLVTKGLLSGNMVALYADKVTEGAIILW